MSKVNLELQLKFLNQLDQALDDALSRYDKNGDVKTDELNFMREEVMRARKVVACRIEDDKDSGTQDEVKARYESIAAQ